MMDALFNSPLFAIGFIFFVLVLGLIYMGNRERAKVSRLKGPRRFQPDWSRTGAPRKKRRWKRDRFRPEWDRSGTPPADRDRLSVVEGGKKSDDKSPEKPE